MSLLQLNPQLPVWVEGKGEGYAILVTDYSQDHHKIWTIVFNDSGEIWDVENPKVRVQWNLSLGREKPTIEGLRKYVANCS